MMTETERKIKEIVFDEFGKLIKNIEGDFGKNYIKKRYNFFA